MCGRSFLPHTVSEHPSAERHLAVRVEQDDLDGLVWNAEDEYLALEARDPLRWEVHHRDHLPPHEALKGVVGGELVLWEGAQDITFDRV